MAHLNLSFEDLASVICLACYLGNADGNFSEEEMTAILKAITEQYNFEGREDLLRQYINAGFDMNPQEALRRVAAFGPEEKQWTSNFFVKTIVADNNLEESEKSLYWDIMEKCGLPDNNLSGDSESSAPAESHLKYQVCIAFQPVHVAEDVYDTRIDFVKYPFEQENLRNDLFHWFNNPETLQFCRRSKVLDALNKQLGLDNGWHLLLVYAKPEHWYKPGPNKAATLIDGEDKVFGPALLLVEGEGKVAKGCQFESFAKTIFEALFNLDNNFLVSGEEARAVTVRYLATALTALKEMPKQD